MDQQVFWNNAMVGFWTMFFNTSLAVGAWYYSVKWQGDAWLQKSLWSPMKAFNAGLMLLISISVIELVWPILVWDSYMVFGIMAGIMAGILVSNIIGYYFGAMKAFRQIEHEAANQPPNVQ